MLAVKPRKEAYVERQLKSAGFNAVYPRYWKRVRHARSAKTVAAPLFPGYLFVNLKDAQTSLRYANWISGSLGFLGVNNRPSALPPTFVKRFISDLDSDNTIKFRENLKLGDRVQAIGGPFDRITGEVVDLNDEQRIVVLLDAINRKVEATLSRTAVICAA